MIVGALRTAIGTAGKAFADVPAADLAAPVLVRPRRRAARTCSPETSCSATAWDPAATSPGWPSLTAGLPVEVPALTVDRQCGSGLAAIDVAVSMLHGSPGLVLAGGVESASTAPWRLWPPAAGREPERYERAPFAPASHGDPDMGLAADLLAEQRGVDRDRQDAYAARSHARAARTRDSGGFDAEVVPVAGVCRDERPRDGLERRAARPAPSGVP